jgi:predicted Rossmann fold nucleotide-binding protein DprA/Smf involved in DNA uptake
MADTLLAHDPRYPLSLKAAAAAGRFAGAPELTWQPGSSSEPVDLGNLIAVVGLDRVGASYAEVMQTLVELCAHSGAALALSAQDWPHVAEHCAHTPVVLIGTATDEHDLNGPGRLTLTQDAGPVGRDRLLASIACLVVLVDAQEHSGHAARTSFNAIALGRPLILAPTQPRSPLGTILSTPVARGGALPGLDRAVSKALSSRLTQAGRTNSPLAHGVARDLPELHLMCQVLMYLSPVRENATPELQTAP